jgi:hypothetical protein
VEKKEREMIYGEREQKQKHKKERTQRERTEREGTESNSGIIGSGHIQKWRRKIKRGYKGREKRKRSIIKDRTER